MSANSEPEEGQSIGGSSSRTVQEKRRCRSGENVGVARAGYDYAAAHFTDFPESDAQDGEIDTVMSGNIAMAMGGAAVV